MAHMRRKEKVKEDVTHSFFTYHNRHGCFSCVHDACRVSLKASATQFLVVYILWLTRTLPLHNFVKQRQEPNAFCQIVLRQSGNRQKSTSVSVSRWHVAGFFVQLQGNVKLLSRLKKTYQKLAKLVVLI